MNISLNLVLEALQPYKYDSRIDSTGQLQFGRLCLLPDDAGDFELERLYVGELSQALSMKRSGASFFCVCIRDRLQDSLETDEVLSGLIIINENISFRKIYTVLQDLFYSVSEWVNKMNRYAYEKRPLQEILELSEPIIGNFISVSDSALKLISYTSHISTEDDPISRKLLQNGFHPEETVDAFKRTGQFEIWDKTVGLVINTEHDLSPFDLCSKVFKYHNTYYVHMVMTCNHRPLTQAVMELFQMLADVLELYVEGDWKLMNYRRHAYDGLLIDLIERNISDPALITERSKQVNVPMRGPYQLNLIDFTTLDKIPIGRIEQELSSLFPNAKVTSYQNRILVLRSLTGAKWEEAGNRFYTQLRQYLEEYNANCGVSTAFDLLPELASAYDQAVQTIKYGRMIRTIVQEKSDILERVIFYDKIFLLITVGENPESRSMWRKTRYYRMLKVLTNHDEKHSTNNIELLYTYLLCDCRAPEASALLHMHRNNVLYRIGRIEELLEAKLTDEEVKRGLLDSYVYLRLYGID